MTKRWKLKINSSNTLLVLITLILVKAEWVEGENVGFWELTNAIESSNHENLNGQTHIYVGNDEIAEYYFHPSINNNSFILDGVRRCLDSFQLMTCVKMLLLSRVNDILTLMEEPNVSQKDVRLLNGILIFKIKNETITMDYSEKNDNLSLDEEIAVKVKKIFQNRSLLVNLLPNFKIQIEPASGQDREDFICFKYSRDGNESNAEDDDQGSRNEGRKKKGGGMSMMMMVPQLIMLGLMPFTLASLKAMVMNAVMINMMALNGAIFMTIRNLVFGPRQGDNVKYVNYGYSKDRQTQSPKPVLIIHSPAAFVKQPPVRKKQVYGQSSHRNTLSYFPESHYLNAGSSSHYQNGENINDYEGDYYYIQQTENQSNRRHQGIQNRNKSGWMKGDTKINVNGQVRIQNKNIYQREIKQEEKEKRQKTPSFGSKPDVNHYKISTNFNYSDVDVEGRQTATRYQILSRRRAHDKEKTELKPNPQWNSVGNERS